MHVPLDRLNDQQQRAATCGDGAHLVLAGPGTGKTATLIARVAHLIATGVDPVGIVAVTFTRKAADQLTTRLAQMTGGPAPPVAVGTFHALAGRMLRRFPDAAGLGSDFRIIDDAAQRQVLTSLRVRWNPDDDGDLLDIIAGAKERLLTPDAFAAALPEAAARDDRSPLKRAAEIYRAYQAHLAANNLVDFADLIGHVVRALEADPTLRAECAGRVSHLLIDEYQDVNPAQIRLVDALVPPTGNLWVVGDDDQCLYGFRSADVGIILSFCDHRPGATVHRLVRTYRSAPAILTLAHAMITKSARRFDKAIEPVADKGPRVVIVPHRDAEAEARWLADAVARVRATGVGLGQIAVLFRTGAATVWLRLALRRAGLAYVVRGARDLWTAFEVRLFLRFVEVATRPEAPLPANLQGPKVRRVVEAAGRVAGQPFAAILRAAEAAVAEARPRQCSAERAAEWAQNLRAIQEIAHEAGALAPLLDTAAREAEARRGPDPTDAVVVSTVHSAKGLEWDAVFVAACEEGVLPHFAAADLDEERRIAYVAMTRARRWLVLSYTASRFQTSCQPSRFLFDATRGAPPACFEWRGGVPPEPRVGPRTPPAAPPAPVRRGADTAQAKAARAAERRQRNLDTGKPARAGFRWDEGEDTAVRDGFDARRPLEAIAEGIERSVTAVVSRMVALDLIEAGFAVERYQRHLDPEGFRALQLEAIVALADQVLGPDAACWLDTPHPTFDGVPPRTAADRPDAVYLARKCLLGAPDDSDDSEAESDAA